MSNRIEQAALDWNAARIRALGLKRARAAEQCQEEMRSEPEVGISASPPCWRTYRITYDGYRERLPQAEWCEPCIRREAIHLEYREAMRQRGACMRRLERLAVPA